MQFAKGFNLDVVNRDTPCRFGYNGADLLDNFLTNMTPSDFKSRKLCYSDHTYTECKLVIAHRQGNEGRIPVKNYTLSNIDKFIACVVSEDWSGVYGLKMWRQCMRISFKPSTIF